MDAPETVFDGFLRFCVAPESCLFRELVRFSFLAGSSSIRLNAFIILGAATR